MKSQDKKSAFKQQRNSKNRRRDYYKKHFRNQVLNASIAANIRDREVWQKLNTMMSTRRKIIL